LDLDDWLEAERELGEKRPRGTLTLGTLEAVSLRANDWFVKDLALLDHARI
jgi:hypothetical protein